MFEYKVLWYEMAGDLTFALNRHAEDGWQLHTVSADAGGLYVVMIRYKYIPEQEEDA